MTALRKLLLVAGVVGAVLALAVGPAVADVEGEEAPAEDAPTEAPAEDAEEGAEDEGGRIQLAETPRDRIGLILLLSLVVAGGAAAANARRQLKGERPQATGEFRWR